MLKSFDPVQYISQVGQELVAAFENAGFGTTPGQVGSAREVPVRDKLKHLLPAGVGVGSGCVIDSFGNTSKSMDVILYEKEICPIFQLNQDPVSTYYPCEGVIAAGEIKSALDSKELRDVFEKIESVKSLRRLARSSPSGIPGQSDYVAFRMYGSLNSAVAPRPKDFNQDLHSTDQIFGFALVGRVELSASTLCAKYVEHAKVTSYSHSPNLIVALDGQVICPLSIPPNRHNPLIALSAQDANAIYCVDHKTKSFPFLLARLQATYTTGRTVSATEFDRYFVEDGLLTLPSNGTCLPLAQTS